MVCVVGGDWTMGCFLHTLVVEVRFCAYSEWPVGAALRRETMMFFKQLVREDLGCASYVVGCTSAGVCAVVDPRLDMVDEILRMADEKGMKISAVIETHNHADHISGHGEIARRTGAQIYVHEQAGV